MNQYTIIMTRKTFFLILTIGIISLTTNAQEYKTGIGARLGTFNGLTIKHFVGESNAIEGLASFRWDGFIITGLYEWQKPLVADVDGLDYYLGFGAHIGSWGNGRNKYWNNDNRDDGFTIVGVDFIAGLEYTFQEVPFSLSLDWKPAINFGGYGWWSDGVALSIRYTFK